MCWSTLTRSWSVPHLAVRGGHRSAWTAVPGEIGFCKHRSASVIARKGRSLARKPGEGVRRKWSCAVGDLFKTEGMSDVGDLNRLGF